MIESSAFVEEEELEAMMFKAKEVFQDQFNDWRINPQEKKVKVAQCVKQKTGQKFPKKLQKVDTEMKAEDDAMDTDTETPVVKKQPARGKSSKYKRY